MSPRPSAAVNLMSGLGTRSPDLARDATKVRILIVSDVRLYREALALCVGQNERLTIVGAVERGGAIAEVERFQPDLVLLDAGEWHGLDLAKTLLEHRPKLSIVALAVPETAGRAIASIWRGIAGFVPTNGSINDVISVLERLTACGRHEAIALAAPVLVQGDGFQDGIAPRPTLADLTRREGEILEQIELGLSNKEIARKLRIEVGTVKNHVHNILEKLNVRCRNQAAHCMRARSA